MKKKCVLAAMMIVAMGMTACSSEPKDGSAKAGAITESKTIQAEIKPANTELAKTEPAKEEKPETNADENEGEADFGEMEIDQGDPLVVVVDRYEDNIIVARDGTDEDIIYYFSTKDAEVIEGDFPITAGDIVEITYRGVQGDEEHPGMAVKVVAESMMYK